MRNPSPDWTLLTPVSDAAFARLLVGRRVRFGACGDSLGIIATVADEGDAALLRYTNQFDGRALSDPEDFQVSPSALVSASQAIDPGCGGR